MGIDLSNFDLAALKRHLRRRESIESRGGNPPPELQLKALQEKYNCSDADLQLCLKGISNDTD